MAINVSKAGPYFQGSSSISFSQLRSNFRAQNSDETFNVDNGAISISDLYRITSATATDPQVPNSTENQGIPTAGEIDLSDFRNSIKYYFVTQTGTDTNVDLDNQNWNSNLNLNIRKFARMNGTCGSSTGAAAVQFNATARNVTIEVEGSILGASGASGENGQSGGTALNVNSAGGFNNTVFVEGTGEVFGGGGGGATGGNGGAGGGGGQQQQNVGTNQCCFGVVSGTGPAGSGGAGGAGAAGRGFNNQTGQLTAQGGQDGGGGSRASNSGSGCLGLQGSAQSGKGGDGGKGGAGGKGGNWGQNGGNGKSGAGGQNGGNGSDGGCSCLQPCQGNFGNGGNGNAGGTGGTGGSAGSAITGGNNFTITGAQGSNRIKGPTF